MLKKIFFFTLVLVFTFNCSQNEVIKTHGVAYLKKREKLIIVNVSNKNDSISILGQPSTKGMSNDNLWIYIERTRTRGKLLKLGRNYLKKNNVLVLEFNKYGILEKKEFFKVFNSQNILTKVYESVFFQLKTWVQVTLENFSDVV